MDAMQHQLKREIQPIVGGRLLLLVPPVYMTWGDLEKVQKCAVTTAEQITYKAFLQNASIRITAFWIPPFPGIDLAPTPLHFLAFMANLSRR